MYLSPKIRDNRKEESEIAEVMREKEKRSESEVQSEEDKRSDVCALGV